MATITTDTSAPVAEAPIPVNAPVVNTPVTSLNLIKPLVGIAAPTAVGADVTGWLEVVADNAMTTTIEYLGLFKTRGNWFYLDNTNGSVGQVLQVPTNGGGADTRCAGVWVEESSPRASTYTWSNDELIISLTAHNYCTYHEVDIVFSTGGATADGTYEIIEVVDEDTFKVTLTGSGTGGNCTVTKFQYWTSLNDTTCSWNRQCIGAAFGETDRRQSFVKDLGSGQMQIGEASDLAATYANVTALTGTYATFSYSSSVTYTWIDNVITVIMNANPDNVGFAGLYVGQDVYFDFTSGGAVGNNGTYTLTFASAYYLKFTLAGSGTGGNCTVIPGITITVANHNLAAGEIAYFSFTSGSGVSGEYTVFRNIDSSSSCRIEHPHSGGLSGNVTVYAYMRISYTAHTLAIGNRVYLDFTSGTGVDGLFTIVATTADTFDVLYSHSSALSGNVTVKQTLGHVPTSGLRIRIPNIFLRACITTTRASNCIPNATLGTRPDFVTYNRGGSIDNEFIYSQWYCFLQIPGVVRLHHFAVIDSFYVAQATDLVEFNDGGFGSYTGSNAYGWYPLSLTQTTTGSILKNVVVEKGGGAGYSPLNISSSTNLSMFNCRLGNVLYTRSASNVSLSNLSNIYIKNFTK